MIAPLLAALLLSSAAQTDCSALNTQSDMNICAAGAAKEADARLNRSYIAATAALKDKGVSVAPLTSAELAWIDMRDKTCAFERGLYTNGSLAPYIASTCVTRLSDARAHRLDNYAAAVRGNSIQQRRSVDPNVDAKLNATYTKLRKMTPTWAVSQLENAELSWIKYRDRACAAEGGSCVTDLEAERTTELAGAYPEAP